MFDIVVGGSSTLSLVSFIGGVIGCVAVIGCTVDCAIIAVAVIGVGVIVVVRCMIATFSGGHGLSAVLWLA